MSFHRLVDLIENYKEEEVEETTDSSAIAYIPGGFRSVQKALKTLSKMKTDWGVEVIEQEGKRLVDLEGELTIVVDNNDWDDFINMKLLTDGMVESGITISLLDEDNKGEYVEDTERTAHMARWNHQMSWRRQGELMDKYGITNDRDYADWKMKTGKFAKEKKVKEGRGKLTKICKWCDLKVYTDETGYETWEDGDNECKHSLVPADGDTKESLGVKVESGMTINLLDEGIQVRPQDYKTAEEYVKAQKPMYHGSDIDIDRFDMGKVKKWNKFGHFFTQSKDFANMFGDKTTEAVVNVKNPKVISQQKWWDIRGEHAKDDTWFSNWKKQLQKEGYDGLKVTGDMDKVGKHEVERPELLVAFEDTQIKTKAQLTKEWEDAQHSARNESINEYSRSRKVKITPRHINREMNSDTYKLRRKVMDYIYRAKNLFRAEGLQMPRVDVRITDMEKGHENVLATARLGDHIVWVPASTTERDDLQAIVFHELVHAIFGVGHIKSCPLMSATTKKSDVDVSPEEWDKIFTEYIKKYGESKKVKENLDTGFKGSIDEKVETRINSGSSNIILHKEPLSPVVEGDAGTLVRVRARISTGDGGSKVTTFYAKPPKISGDTYVFQETTRDGNIRHDVKGGVGLSQVILKKSDIISQTLLRQNKKYGTWDVVKESLNEEIDQVLVYRAKNSKRQEGLPGIHVTYDKKLALRYGSDVEMFSIVKGANIVTFNDKVAQPIKNMWGKATSNEIRSKAKELNIDGIDYALEDYGIVIFNEDILTHMNESINEEDTLTKIFYRLEKAIYSKLAQQNVVRIDKQFGLWEKYFGFSSYGDNMGVAIPYSRNAKKMKKEVRDLMKQLKIAYKDDAKEIRRAATALEAGQSIGAVKILQDFPFFFGGSINSKFKGFSMTFEAYVDNNMIISETIKVNDPDILEAVEEDEDVRVVGDVLFPRGKYFKRTVFRSLRDAI